MRRILAALDDSRRTPLVLQTAMDLAKQSRASLILFRAVDVPPEFPPAAALGLRDGLRPKMIADARSTLDELANQPRSLGIETSIEIVVSSETWRAIIDAAEARGADAIVVGSHGYRAIDRILGTTTARVADHACCLVIVVHEAPSTQPSRRASDGPYRTKS